MVVVPMPPVLGPAPLLVPVLRRQVPRLGGHAQVGPQAWAEQGGQTNRRGHEGGAGDTQAASLGPVGSREGRLLRTKDGLRGTGVWSPGSKQPLAQRSRPLSRAPSYCAALPYPLPRPQSSTSYRASSPWPTCVHVRAAAQGALRRPVAPVSSPLVVALGVFRRHPLQGVVVQAPGLGAQHGGRALHGAGV